MYLLHMKYIEFDLRCIVVDDILPILFLFLFHGRRDIGFFFYFMYLYLTRVISGKIF